jgi:hypothetical protein
VRLLAVAGTLPLSLITPSAEAEDVAWRPEKYFEFAQAVKLVATIPVMEARQAAAGAEDLPGRPGLWAVERGRTPYTPR